MLRMLRRLNLWRATPAIALSVAAAVLAAGLCIALYTERAYTEQKAKEVDRAGPHPRLGGRRRRWRSTIRPRPGNTSPRCG